MTETPTIRIVTFANLPAYYDVKPVKVTADEAFWRRLLGTNWDRIPGLNVWRAHKIMAMVMHHADELYRGKLPEGVTFFGSYRDYDTRGWIQDPKCNRGLVTLLAQHLAKRDGAMVDVGTNLGILTSLVANALPGREHLCIEANPHTARIAARTLYANRIEKAKLVVCAVGDTEGVVELHFTPFHSGNAGLGRTASKVPDRIVKTPMITLDKLLASLTESKVAVIKIDVEGFEPEVIMGAMETIRAQRPVLVLEFNDSAKGRSLSYSSVFAQLRDIGYSLSWLLDSTDVSSLQPEAAGQRPSGGCDVVCVPRDR